MYTDVDGVFNADPRLVPGARKLEAVSFMEMLEMASTGARVLQSRSVEYARNYGVPLHVRSSFHPGEGTWIKSEDDVMEKAIISAVTHDFSEAKVTVLGVPDQPGVAARLFGMLADANTNVDMIIQNVSDHARTDISFTVPKDDLERVRRVTDEVVRSVGAQGCTYDDDIAKISLIGAGMRSHPGIAAGMFKTLADNQINIEMISTSPGVRHKEDANVRACCGHRGGHRNGGTGDEGCARAAGFPHLEPDSARLGAFPREVVRVPRRNIARRGPG
jgi:aspartate kinase